MTSGSTPCGGSPGYLVRPVTADGWDDLAAFFGPSGAYAHCWCTYFRQSGREFAGGCVNAGEGNRAMLQRLTIDEAVPGLTAHAAAGDPVGWVSVAPRQQYPRVLRSPLLRSVSTEEPGVWSVVCFWVPRPHRGQGVARALLDGAVAHAAAGGAAVVEGYPVAAAEHVPDASAYHGTEALFAGAGFVVVARPEGRRVVVRRPLLT